jgi:hypothetical protein
MPEMKIFFKNIEVYVYKNKNWNSDVEAELQQNKLNICINNIKMNGIAVTNVWCENICMNKTININQHDSETLTKMDSSFAIGKSLVA